MRKREGIGQRRSSLIGERNSPTSRRAKRRKRIRKEESKQRRRVHICCPDPHGRRGCPASSSLSLVPPRRLDYIAEWLSAAAKKLVKQGAEQELRSAKDPLYWSERPSEVERRWKEGFVYQPIMVLSSRRGGVLWVARDGTGGDHASPSPVSLRPAPKVKVEEAEVISDSDCSKDRGRPKKKRSLGTTLAEDAASGGGVRGQESAKSFQLPAQEEEEEEEASQEEKLRLRRERPVLQPFTTSSEASLMAPLKKRSRKSPGSVYRMWESTAVERLSADGIVEEGYEAAGLRGRSPRC